jgi:predicted transcriptional regulator YdeE
MQPNRFEDGRPMLLGGLRQYHAFTAAAPGIAAQWRRFESHELAGQAGSSRFGVMCGADHAGFEYMCAVEVESLESLPEGAGRMRVPPQHYAVFVHERATQSLGAVWQAIFAWLGSSDYESAHKPDFEVYSAGVEPLAASGSIEIWIGVVPRARGA